MPKSLFILAIALFISSTTLAQPNWKSTKAIVTFKIRNAGLNVDGSFKGFDGMLIFDPAAPEKGQLSATVETATLETGITMRNNHVKKEEYFDVATYPKIKLKSTNITKKGNNEYVGTFALTLKKTTKNVTIPFTFTQTGSTGQFEGEFSINRRDYDVGGRSLLMSNEATIHISIQAQSTPL